MPRVFYRTIVTSDQTPAHASAATSWLGTEGHRQWLHRGFAAIMGFALQSIRPGGGFHYQDTDGSPIPGRNPQLFLTARTAYVAALGVAEGVPGSGALLDHGMASLLGLHADVEHGGWLSEPGVESRKSTYDHVHVGLAAAAALGVDHPDASRLFDQVAEVIDRHLWDDETQTLRESFGPDWSDPEDYRGANANMHGFEAMLAMGTASGDAQWYRRGLAIADRLVNGAARANGWLLPEHYSADWEVLTDYNRDEPMHPFRPYGATFGHSLEWARFLVELDQPSLLDRAELDGAPWLLEGAEALTRRALDDGWGLDGRPGLVYTVDWDGTPVATVRLHWPICEGIQTTAALYHRTGDWHWEQWYRKLWDHAARWFIDGRGTWRNELDDDMNEGGEVWPGRPDIYHSGGAYIGPLAL